MAMHPEVNVDAMRTVLPVTPSFRLDGRRALITGAGRGIGMAASVALAEAGADVTLIARSTVETRDIAAAIRNRGLKATSVSLDVTDTTRVAEFVRDTGPYQVLINNAGTNRPALLSDTPDVDIDIMLDLNVKATINMSREVSRGLVAQKMTGSIVQISSQMGHVGAPRRTIYCASKHAVEGFTKALACELGPHGIRVNSICPTFIATDMTRAQLEQPEFRRMVLDKIVLGRIGELTDIMGAVVFLSSDAAAMITGASLLVDGGWTAA